MTKTTGKRRTTASRRRAPTIHADPETIRQALRALGIDRPFYTCKVVGSRLEFSLYGGDVAFWPPKPARRTRS